MEMEFFEANGIASLYNSDMETKLFALEYNV